MGQQQVAETVVELRALSQQIAALQAEQLRLLADLAAGCEAEALAELATRPRVPGQPCDEEVVATAVTDEVMAVLGVSHGQAQRFGLLARRLTRVLPHTLDALAAGRLDLTRAQVLAEATEGLADATARAVESLVLPGAGSAPWDGPSPRAWRGRVERAVVRADVDAARRRREAAVRLRAVRAWPWGDGTGVLQIHAADHDIAMADQVITDLARAWPSVGPDGEPLSMDQRRVDALMDVLRRIRDGAALPTVPVRREREIGLVLHADTLFADGPAADAPGELRGLGGPAAVDPRSAAETARAEIARGVRTCAVLTDTHGAVQRLVPLGRAPRDGWTREQLTAAVTAALTTLPPLYTPTYTPTAAIAEHVRAVHPRCVSYDCARSARRCDLDHDEPWPRGPTSSANVAPRCRRHHEHKTRGLVRTRLHVDGSVTATMLTGVQVVVRPEPLPGFGPGEGYDAGRRVVDVRPNRPDVDAA